MKKCYECGHGVEAFDSPYLYDESGLPNVVLVGVGQHRCVNKACGEVYVTVPQPAELHDRLAEHLLTKPRLTRDEFRFLRVFGGWSGRDLARLLEVTPETVSRWENGKAELKQSVILALKALVTNSSPIADYRLHDLFRQSVTAMKSSSTHPFEALPQLMHDLDGWHMSLEATPAS